MAFRRKSPGWSGVAAALGAVAVLGLSAGPASAQQNDPMDDLLEKLKNKGVLSDDEYQVLKKAREEEQIEVRKERRRQAQKAAQDAAKEESEKEAAAKKTKFDVSPSVRSIQLFGDIRVRYESRTGETDAAPGVSGANQALDRWRYAVRVGIRGELVDNWYYGLRLETSTSARSTWVTFGGDTVNSPSAKTQDSINVGWAYFGVRPTGWLDLTVGRMPNPFYTAGPLVWDPDINPEGLAEKFSFALNDATTLFANFAQMSYQDVNPAVTNGINVGFHSQGAYILGFQGGVNHKFNPDTSLKAAVSYYDYQGNPTTTAPAATPGQILAGPYTGQPGGNQIGINNLQVLEVPLEFNFRLFGQPAKVYGEFAINLDADERARLAGFPNSSNQDKAYLVGFSLGALKKKNDWEARLYWQRQGQYALDPNLVDSDWFDSRLNLRGWVVSAGYNITDAIFAAARYGRAKRSDTTLGTGGVGDITLNPLDDYQLLQLDLGWKF